MYTFSCWGQNPSAFKVKVTICLSHSEMYGDFHDLVSGWSGQRIIMCSSGPIAQICAGYMY